MQTRIQNTMGMAVPFEVPSSIEEFAELAGVPSDKASEVVLKFAIDEAMYRVILPNFRPRFLEKLADATNSVRNQTGTVKRMVDGETQEVPVYETDGKFHKRICEEQGKKPEDYSDLASQLSEEMGFDIKAKPRGSGRVAKEYYARVDGLREAIADGKGTWKGVVSTLNKLNPGVSLELNGDGEPDTDALAAALKADSERRAAEQANELLPTA